MKLTYPKVEPDSSSNIDMLSESNAALLKLAKDVGAQ